MCDKSCSLISQKTTKHFLVIPHRKFICWHEARRWGGEQATGFIYIYIYIYIYISNDLHNLQTQKTKQKCNIKMIYIKLNNTSTEPYVLFQDAIRLLKDNRNYKIIIKKRIWSINPKYTPALTRMLCNN